MLESYKLKIWTKIYSKKNQNQQKKVNLLKTFSYIKLQLNRLNQEYLS